MSFPRSIAPLVVATALTLSACGSSGEVATESEPVSTAGRLVLAIQGADARGDEKRCSLTVAARNETGFGALNVQAAWMAKTDGFGIISDYQFLGDFSAGETREIHLSIVGAPCNAVSSVKLTRAVCVVAPAQDPPESCADRVVLDGGGVLTVEH